MLTDGLTASVQRRHEQCMDRRCWRIVAYPDITRKKHYVRLGGDTFSTRKYRDFSPLVLAECTGESIANWATGTAQLTETAVFRELRKRIGIAGGKITSGLPTTRE